MDGDRRVRVSAICSPWETSQEDRGRTRDAWWTPAGKVRRSVFLLDDLCQRANSRPSGSFQDFGSTLGQRLTLSLCFVVSVSVFCVCVRTRNGPDCDDPTNTDFGPLDGP